MDCSVCLVTEKITARIKRMKFFLKDKIEISVPVMGKVIELKEVKDKCFKNGLLGEGFAVVPENGDIVAPFTGRVISVFPTKNAISLCSEDGLEILIHVGLDTFCLNGKYFEVFVKDGQRVKKGQKLISFDIANLEREGYITQTPVLITNINRLKKMFKKNLLIKVK